MKIKTNLGAATILRATQIPRGDNRISLHYVVGQMGGKFMWWLHKWVFQEISKKQGVWI
jgi:hypothetical protein